MISNPYEYLAEMERLRLFTARAAIPEHNTPVWRAYLEMYQSHVGDARDIPIVIVPEGPGFYRDPLDEHDIYNWALMGAICHPILPFAPVHLVACMDRVLDTFARAGISKPTIVTETFEMIDTPEQALASRFLWINSPRARLHDSFDAYVSSLSSSRRQQLRRLFDSFSESNGFRFELSSRAPDTREMDFILDNLAQQWGARDMPYALVQNLWPMAVARVMPERSRFMRVYHKDELAFLNAFIVRDQVITSQSTCKNVALSFSGLGIVIDFKAIQFLCGNDSGIRHLDPTCRMAAVDDAPAIAVAKRKVVNENARKPTLLAGYDLPALEVAYPHLDPVHHWVIPEAPAIIGAPV